MRYAFHIIQFYHSFGQKTHRPPGVSLGRLVARKGDQMRLYRSVNFLLGILPHVRATREYGSESFSYHVLANALHRLYRHFQRFADLFIFLRGTTFGLVRFEQYRGPGYDLRGPLSRFHYLFECFPLFFSQSHYVLLHQSAPCFLCCSPQTDLLHFGSLLRVLPYPIEST